MKRYINFEDIFEIKCKKCNSNNVTLDIKECSECGNTISATCNTCGSKYNYHDFKKIEE